MFGETGDLLRYAAESLETLWGGGLLEFYTKNVVPKIREGSNERFETQFLFLFYLEQRELDEQRILAYGKGGGAAPGSLGCVLHAVRHREDGVLRCALAVARRHSFRGCEQRPTCRILVEVLV